MKKSRSVIIASAAYLDPQLEAEFGHIPPAFLPLGSRRLYEHQIECVRADDASVLLSLPEDFVLSDPDAEALAALGVTVVPVPLGLTLGQSLVYVINVSARAIGPISVLHGDTLLEGIDLEVPDAVSVGPALPGYQWGNVTQRDGMLQLAERRAGLAVGETTVILTGWFSFSDTALLVQAITQQGGHFINGLLAYVRLRQVQTLEARNWFDFGHADTYYQSRRRVTTQRAFNDLTITRRTVIKTSGNLRKMQAEANWFEQLPPSLRIHVPALLDSSRSANGGGYSLEYLHLPTLTELFVFGRLSAPAWRRIFESCDEALTGMAAFAAPEGETGDVDAIYRLKTQERLEEHARATGIDLNAPLRFGRAWLPSLERMAAMAADAIPAAGVQHLTLIHGDFCFSNLLYDHRADLIRMIDPRGIDAQGGLCRFGDRRYDIGKLYHSVVGRYDQIVAGHYKLQCFGELDFDLSLPSDKRYADIETEFSTRLFAGLSVESAAAPAIGVLLFLSMLPLHADNPMRQRAFLANAMRLFLAMDGKCSLRGA